MRIQIVITTLFMAALMAVCCRPENVSKPVGQPEMHGTYAYVAASESGRQDLFITCGAKTADVSATWKINSPSQPDFAPDGKTVYFQAKENGRWGLYRYDISTGALPVCISSEIKFDCTYPQLSADGSSLVFVRGGQIASMNLANSSVDVLTFDANADYSSPTLSADGKTLVFAGKNAGKGILHKLDIASLSSSTLPYGGSLSCPVYCGETLVYVSSGEGICVDGKTVLEGGEQPKHAFGDWVVFSKDGKGHVGNIKTGESYCVLDAKLSRLAYSGIPVEIAEPEDGGRTEEQGDVINSDTDRPALSGRMVYHNYTSYDSMDSRMYIYDFADNSLTEISRGWTVVNHPMNASFSPDGKWITFMGIGTATGSWDIFLYELGSLSQPRNLTPDGSYRDEDPKFSYDGSKVCFKRNDHLGEINVSTGAMKIFAENLNEPMGMPYYTVDDNSILFGGGNNPNSYIGIWHIASGTWKKLYDKAGTVEYYPITIDDKSFYYTQHYSPTDGHDQLYKGFFDGSPAQCLAFNNNKGDYSDACVVGSQWLILVSTRAGSKGGYDLYIAHETSGAIFSLSAYNDKLNTGKNELGPDYTTAR